MWVIGTYFSFISNGCSGSLLSDVSMNRGLSPFVAVVWPYIAGKK